MSSEHPSDPAPGSLTSLKESLLSMQTNTSKMLSRIQKFENRLKNIDAQMKPIQNTTSSYMKAKENIALTLVEVGKTYEYFRITAEIDGIITGGLHYVNASSDGSPSYSNYDDYWSSTAKLYQARQFFESNKSIKASHKIKEINDLIKIAEDSCNAELTRILTKVGLAIEATNGEYKVTNPLLDEDAENIKAVCNQLEFYGYESHFATFTSVRSGLIKEYMKSFEIKYENDWYSLYTNTTIRPEDLGIMGLSVFNKDKMYSNRNIMPYRRGSNPFRLYYEVALLIIRGELQLWAATLPLLLSASSSSSSSPSESSSNKSVVVFVNLCDVITREMQRLLAPFLQQYDSAAGGDPLKRISRSAANKKISLENDNSSEMSNESILKQTNLILIRFDVLDIFNSKFDEFRDYCRPDVRHETTASYSIVVLRNNIVTSLTDNLHQVMETSLGVASITQFNAYITAHKDDATFSNITDIDPITSGILHCCEELSSCSTIYRAFTELADSLAKGLPENMSNVYSCIVSLTENLISYLRRKSEIFSQIPSLKPAAIPVASTEQHSLFEVDERHSDHKLLGTYEYMFLINNLHLLSRFLKDFQRETKIPTAAVSNQRSKSALLQSFYKQMASFSASVDLWLSESEELFFDVIEKAVGMAKSDLDHLKADVTNDKSGKNRVLKSKFSVFNSGLDALMSLQGVLSVASPQLREPLGERLAAHMLVRYTDFHGTYSKTNFSKKHQKDYVKYAPSDLKTMLSGFFGKNQNAVAI